MHGKLHVIDFGKNSYFEGREFMCYHADGFCFKVSARTPEENDDIRDVENGFVFNVFSDYDGFQKIDDDNILRVLKRTLKVK